MLFWLGVGLAGVCLHWQRGHWGRVPAPSPWLGAPGDTIPLPLPYKDPVVLASAARGGSGAQYVRRVLRWHGWDLAQTLLPEGP